MSLAPVVCNSSPLIALDQIGQLDLLERLFTSVLVPPAVVRETAPTVVLPGWITEQSPAQPIGPQILSASLGLGESEAISLALEIHAAWIILDDRPARRLAQALGLTVIGTLGLLLAAKRRGYLAVVKPSLDSLVHHGFHIAADLYQRILTDAGESP
jgi:predicted nucleic acid-binding protein